MKIETIDVKNASRWEDLETLKPEELYSLVVANRVLLRTCQKHSFVLPKNHPRREKLKCKSCGGFMEPIFIFYYKDGFKDGGGDAKGIIVNHEGVDLS